MFLLVPAYPGCPGSKAVKRSSLLLLLFQFLSTSLDNLVSLLLKSGRDKFTRTTKFLGDDDLVFTRGVYPYSYMTGAEKFAEMQLPPIEAFYNTLEDKPCSPNNYNRACEIWAHYNIIRCEITTIITFSQMFFCWPTYLKIS